MRPLECIEQIARRRPANWPPAHGHIGRSRQSARRGCHRASWRSRYAPPRRGEVTFVGVIRPLRKRAPDQPVRDQEVEVGIALAVRVRRHVLGTPATVVRKSVPWSRLKPRRKYWLACRRPNVGLPSSRHQLQHLGRAQQRQCCSTRSFATPCCRRRRCLPRSCPTSTQSALSPGHLSAPRLASTENEARPERKMFYIFFLTSATGVGICRENSGKSGQHRPPRQAYNKEVAEGNDRHQRGTEDKFLPSSRRR